MRRRHVSDTQFLERHGRSWRVSVHVPVHLRAIIGASKIKKALNTDSLSEAVLRKRRAIADAFQRLAEAEDAFHGGPKAMRAVASRLREEYGQVNCDGLDQEREDDIRAVLQPVTSTLREARDPQTGELGWLIPAEARATINEVRDIVHGRLRPIDAFEDEFLKRSRNKDRTKDDLRRALKTVEKWCKARGMKACFDQLEKQHAVQFFDEIDTVLGKTISPVRKPKYVGVLRKYWAYLEARGRLKINIWASVQIDVPRTTREQKERAFTDEEVRRLLTSNAPPRLHDPMMIAALTGARLDAIICLKVKDFVHGALRFKAQKKESGARLVPVHPSLVEVIKRRCEGRSPEDDLFPEWPVPVSPDSRRERSFKTSNRFTEWRRKIGVDEVVPGNRRARINFHSFRRWFITSADRAGIPETMIKSLVGHTQSGVTLGIYGEGPLLEAARAQIERIRLPDLTSGPIPAPHSVSVVMRDAA